MLVSLGEQAVVKTATSSNRKMVFLLVQNTCHSFYAAGHKKSAAFTSSAFFEKHSDNNQNGYYQMIT
ncbi:MAG: hypothetical protein ACRYG7_25525 [Janthinobacterium lividum]